MKNMQRNSRIELLRIVSIFFIILSHCCIHGLSDVNSNLLLNNILLAIFTLGNLGVAIFVIITGYVSIDKEFKLNKIIRLELTILFYSLIGFAISTLIFGNEIVYLNLLKSILPLTFKKYWFMTAYMLLYMLSPFLNKFLNSLNKSDYISFMLLQIVLIFLVPTLTTSDLYFNELFQFICFYSIGGYINKYFSSDNHYKHSTLVCLLSLLSILLLTTLIIVLSNNIPSIMNYKTYFLNRNSIFVLLLATSLFVESIKRKPFNNKIINMVSSTTLGIYLIHDHPDFRGILWKKIIHLEYFINKPYLIIVLLVTSVIIFITCMIIEIMRKKLFDKVNGSISNKIESLILKTKNRIKQKNTGQKEGLQ